MKTPDFVLDFNKQISNFSSYCLQIADKEKVIELSVKIDDIMDGYNVLNCLAALSSMLGYALDKQIEEDKRKEGML